MTRTRRAIVFALALASSIAGVPTALRAQAPGDNNVFWNELGHDSRDLLYRTPGGAVPAGTPVRIRLRTAHNDVTSVTLRLYDVNAAAQQLLPMSIAASDVSCYEGSLANSQCDFWEVTVTSAAPNNFWYRFIIQDGADTDYYADNTPALDGGRGAVTDEPIDNSYALMFYDPAFAAPAWPRSAVVYQVFPDRFRNGRANNDLSNGAPRYDDPVLQLSWSTLPEGFCRNYADGATNCPWRFDDTPPDWSPNQEQPRGRDYMGGDLKGVDQQLDYFQSLGVTAIYLNPIFDAASNHSYDTQDYYTIDPAFGTRKDWENLVKHAQQRGIRLILDGVFNHLSSDSRFFDRYGRWWDAGACESATSTWRAWFHFRSPAGSEPSPCVPSTVGGTDTYYDGWFGFDSIPVLNKSNAEVVDYFVTRQGSVSRYWLQQGASAWRLDVMGDSSFPAGYWESFRQVVKAQKSDALIVGELWQKDTTLLRHLRGQTADATMNYRLRDAVIGFFAPGPFDSKGFADSGRPLSATELVARLSAIREDYPDAAYYSLMNLLDSHDTERVLWTLTPGRETRGDKEFNAANLADGLQRLRLASLVQFFVPGSPTVYYGDEVGMTGDDDPDNRRTYPWADLGGTPDTSLLGHYQALAAFRSDHDALVDGDFRALLADDANETVALGRKTDAEAAILALNRSPVERTLSIPTAGYLPDGVQMVVAFGVENPVGADAMVAGGLLSVTLSPRSAVVLVSQGVALAPPEPPGNLRVTAEQNAEVSLAWDSVPGAPGYNLYRSPLTGGGYVKVNAAPLAGTGFTDTGLRNNSTYYYVVTAIGASGIESLPSNEVAALPHYSIGWANTQWPPSITHTISVVNRTDNVYGQVWIDGVTSQPGPTPGLRAQVGFGPDATSPQGNPAWTWIDAVFNVDAGNNDEFRATLLPEAVGVFDYLYRYSTTNGRDWLYADLNGPFTGQPPNPGSLTVNSSGDTTPPDTPTGLQVTSTSLGGVSLAWNPNQVDVTLYGYEVLRSDTTGGPYVMIARTTATSYTDTAVQQDATYFYVLRAVDNSFNRSGNSTEVSAIAQLRTVTLVFNVTVPASTDATGRLVYIAGTLNRLDGGLPEWNPAGVVLTRTDATHWSITLTGNEGVAIEYKFTLGSWDFVEKDGSCGEIGNRLLTLSYGTNGVQQVNDTVANWRNVAPCGN